MAALWPGETARLAPSCTSSATACCGIRRKLDILPVVVRETLKSPATLVGPDGADTTAGLFLLVVGRDAYATYDLPASGTLTIGRGETNVVRVDNPLASRSHACLHVGDSMFVEDISSVNSTR